MPPLKKRYNDTEKINYAQDEALRVIANAQMKASDILAEDALNASKRLASDAADALKLLGTRGADDHDLLIELRTKLDGLAKVIDNLINGTARQLSDHETRLNNLEKSKGVQSTLLTVGIGLLTIIAAMVIFHLFGIRV